MYRFEVLSEVFAPIQPVDGLPDLDALSLADNPHVFATPR
jgi:hypothetical protein